MKTIERLGSPKEELPEDMQEDDQQLDAKQGEEAQLGKEMTEVQAELAEVGEELEGRIGELNAHLDELDELQREESLSKEDRVILGIGIEEIKSYVLANPMVNILAGAQFAGGIGSGIRDLAEGRDIKEVASNLLGQVVLWGIVKAVAYLGWGKKAQQEEIARSEKEKHDDNLLMRGGEAMEEQPTEGLEDDTENQIQELREDLYRKYDETV